MKTKLLLLLLLPMLMGASCKKGESGNYVTVYGYVKSKTSGEGLPSMTVYINVYKPGNGIGIIDGSRTDYAGQGKTDGKGYFEFRIKLFDGAKGLEVGLTDPNGNFGLGQYERFKIENYERQELELTF